MNQWDQAVTIIFKQLNKKLPLTPLTDLINLSFSTGLFSKNLKQDKILIFFKKEINRTAATIELSHFYQIFTKVLKLANIN